ncbi:MAG: zinc ribbon domain-containing protein [Bacteroidota bacterium]
MTDGRRECPSCAVAVDAAAAVCPLCGYEFPEPRTGFGPMAWLFVALMLLPALWVLARLL